MDIHNSIFGYPLFDFWISIIRVLDIQCLALFMTIQKYACKLAARTLPTLVGHIFSKVLRVVVKFWRANGHKIMFLDDGIGGSVRYDMALVSRNVARETLLSLGLLIAK